MNDKKDNWNIYYCGEESELTQNESTAATENDALQESDSPVEDIPVSKYRRYDTIVDEDVEEEYSGSSFSRFWFANKKRNLKLLAVLMILLVLMGIALAYFVIEGKLKLIDYDDGINFENADQTNLIEEDEELAFTPVHDVTDASSLKDWLKKWATNNGEKMYSKNVINCLLCGVDTQEGTSGRTDAMILVSLNKKTDKITLVSFMRDSYTYMDINGQNRWYKINSAYNWGGPMTLVETIENNYKIEIDNYVTVDFDTFPKLINALGGITVEVQPYEANYINRTTVHTIESGEEVTLDGWEALVFARIRYSDADGDVSRTRRQRQLVTSLIGKAKTASVGQLNNLANLVLPYVRTNFRKTEILSLGTQAIMQDWMSYEMNQLASPLLKDSEDGSQALTGKDSYMNTGYGDKAEFVWVVDYQLDAYRIQTALYGTSNIEIHDYRESPFDFVSSVERTPSANDESTTESQTEEESERNRLEDLIEWWGGSEETTESEGNTDVSSTEEYTLPYSSDFNTQPDTQDMVPLF